MKARFPVEYKPYEKAALFIRLRCQSSPTLSHLSLICFLSCRGPPFRFEPVADEPPNAVNVAEAIKQVKGNDAALKVVSSAV